jgi:DNA-binding response OmpR family regulator
MRILLVEDEEKVSSFITRGLKAEGFTVDEARDGNSGFEFATKYVYDLIILDVMLPGRTGTELLRQLRANKYEVPILMLTARDSVADKVEHFNAGADDYMSKPFSFAELQVRVKALLRRFTNIHTSIITIGNLEINRLSHQVKSNGRRIELSAKEYALLEYLAINSGRVLSRTMIIEHVWDQSFEGLTNIVDVYIRQLRTKIGDEHTSKLIRTVRGMGYCLSAEEAA